MSTAITKLITGIVLMVTGCLGLVACHSGSSNQTAYYDSICVDPVTQLRMPDSMCIAHPAWWYYVPLGYAVPAYHVRISHYTRDAYVRPKAAVVHVGGVPANGGKAPLHQNGNVKISQNGKTAPIKINKNQFHPAPIKVPGKMPVQKMPVQRNQFHPPPARPAPRPPVVVHH
jgi:hypothetical protein